MSFESGAVVGPMPKRTHRISIGVAGLTYYTAHVALGSHTAIHPPEREVREFLKRLDPAHPITIKVEEL